MGNQHDYAVSGLSDWTAQLIIVPSAESVRLLEDGTSVRLLEDGTSERLLEG